MCENCLLCAIHQLGMQVMKYLNLSLYTEYRNQRHTYIYEHLLIVISSPWRKSGELLS